MRHVIAYNWVMPISANNILTKLRGESDRQRITLYMSKGIFEAFRKKCKDIAASKVLEEMMKDFVSSVDRPELDKLIELAKTLDRVEIETVTETIEGMLKLKASLEKNPSKHRR